MARPGFPAGLFTRTYPSQRQNGSACLEISSASHSLSHHNPLPPEWHQASHNRKERSACSLSLIRAQDYAFFLSKPLLILPHPTDDPSTSSRRGVGSKVLKLLLSVLKCHSAAGPSITRKSGIRSNFLTSTAKSPWPIFRRDYGRS